MRVESGESSAMRLRGLEAECNALKRLLRDAELLAELNVFADAP